jgi:hypothetical protein
MAEQDQIPMTELEQFQKLLTVAGQKGKTFICFIFEEDDKKALKAIDPVVFGNVNIAYVAQKAKLMKEQALKQLEFNSIQSACKTEDEARQILSV